MPVKSNEQRDAAQATALPFALAALVAGFTYGAASAADDQEDVSNVPVRQRSHPEVQPTGLLYEGLIFYPSVLAGTEFDSNVFGSARNPADDIALILAPELRIQHDSQSAQHTLEFGARHYDYQKFDSEDRTEAHALLRSARQLSTDIKLDTVLQAARRFERRGDSLTPLRAAEPIAYRDLRAETTVTKNFNRLGFAVGGSVRHLSYETSTTLSGTPLDQSYRDGTIFTASLKPFYDFSPGYRAYTRLLVSQRDYEGTGALNRDSEGYDARAGLEFTLTPMLFGFAELGWLQNSYSNPLIPDAEGLSAKARLTWLMTPLMTVSLFGAREVAEMAAADVEARIDTTAGVQVDYELRRNLIASVAASYRNEDFTGINRSDDVFQAGTQIDYLVNSYIAVGITYNYFERISEIDEYSFDRHTVMVNVTAQY